jgi:hypothetical protein
MMYSDGRRAEVGDRVQVWDGVKGVVVCSIDDGDYTPDFSRENWAFKERGVVIQTDDGQIFYYDEPDEDLELIARVAQVRSR